MASYMVCEVLCLIPVEGCAEGQETHDLSDYDESNLFKYQRGHLNIAMTSSLSKMPSLLYIAETVPPPRNNLRSPIITTCGPLEQNLKCKQNMP